MADRQRSQDGKRETEEYIDSAETPSHQGRSGGNLERQVGTRDLLKRAEQDRPGVTRVRKSEEKQNDS
ncbi:hypothetical protein N4R57_15200 [Rhodobacteraceae bacterium D3-12]|nr:hypothetical protein N4R57_15200 [Rhodobacteraceae bacterium D3-12]